MSTQIKDGEAGARYPPRAWYRKVPFISTKPIDEPVCLPTGNGDENPDFPEMRANWFSLATFSWLHHIIKVGYTRPLNADELYSMPSHRTAQAYAKRLEDAWERRSRIAEAEKAAGNIPATVKAKGWLRKLPLLKSTPREPKASLMWSLNEVILEWFWIGGLMKLVGDLSIITSPLLVRAIIDSLDDTTSSYQQKRGFGLAVGLFLLLVLSVFGNVHGFYRSYSSGIILRGALIHVIYLRATKLSERARTTGLGVGKLMSLVSADVSRIDFCCGYLHMAWTSIVQIVVCLALSLYTLGGYSALPGFALVALMYPMQNFMVRKLFALRRKSMPFTDSRIKAMVELVASMRLVKTYAWEAPLLGKVSKLRGSEMHILRQRLLLRSVNTAVSFTIPTLAAVVSLICYAATSDTFDSGVVFSALSFFLLLRTPLQMLPVCLSSVADAKAALERLEAFMQADLRAPDAPIYEDMGPAISVREAAFLHHDEDLEPTASADEKLSVQKARLYIDELTVNRGEFVVIVGGVGSGKSSVLRALLGDMRQVFAQDLRLGGAVAYCPQTAWLLSATVRENIVFGRDYDATRYQETIRKCCLEADLAVLSDGDMTIVGEKGVSLSGGQKQRISLARAVYSGQDRPLRFLDDCFSALDAHVGAKVFQNVIVDAKAEAERNHTTSLTHVLVTHSLSMVPYADKIIYLEDGRIQEQGTYKDLLAGGGAFSNLMKFGLKQGGDSTDDSSEDTVDATLQPRQDVVVSSEAPDTKDKIAEPAKPETTSAAPDKKPKELMQQEERLVGSVTWRTYLEYILLGNALLTAPLFILSIVFYQASTILSPLWLSWWQANRYEYLSLGTYMGVYAALGLGQSLGLFCMSASFALFAYYTSSHLHARAASRVLHAPLSFFDTTPQGRITHRFSKDIDAVDNVVGETLRLFISTAVQALGSVILVAIILPYFLAIAAVVVISYVWVGMFYRPAARELRRLNNVLRSKIYEHFSESLTGINTLRAYGALPGFQQDNAKRIDAENRAYWLSIACQRWLNLRLDGLGAVLVLATALLVVGLRQSISPSSGGVVLSYMVTVQSVFGQMIRQSAEIENNMNSIERLLHYASKIPQESPHELEGDAKLKQQGWPQQGQVNFEDVTVSHRPELPPALKGVKLDIRAGQKIGVVGRTGAGKSTLLSSLLRIMERSSGQITIDAVDINDVGLNLLRKQISVISQDAVLFAGTLRYNLDPFEEHNDADLWKVVKQARLVEDEGSSSVNPDQVAPQVAEKTTTSATTALTLDTEIAADGSNLSQGQRSLVSIARALIKRSKILILDEATASIDVQTDAIIQATLQDILDDCTFITVAHRLETIVGVCETVVVMDQGAVAELGGVEELWEMEHGQFRQLCNSAGITSDDIGRGREGLKKRQAAKEEARGGV